MSVRFGTIKDVYDYLDSIPMFGKKGASAANFSLDTIRNFCEEMGNPQNDFKSVHVAGTNGKGTTCRMLASIFQSAGYTTGLFTSPHLIDFRERITVDTEWIPEAALLDFFQQHDELLSETALTYFELTCAICFWYFSHTGVDVAVVETGLGGRLDATNIIHPIATAITSIGMDHADILGNSIEDIAAEKAGIIKENVPVITGTLSGAAMDVIANTAVEKQAPHIPAGIDDRDSARVNGVLTGKADRLTLAERLNSPVVKMLIDSVQTQLSVPPEAVKEGFECWKQRYPNGAGFKKIHPDFDWYFDGAHNEEAVALLIDQLEEIAPLDRWTLVFTMMSDKMSPDTLSHFNNVRSVYYYPLNTPRAATVNQVYNELPNVGILNAEETLPDLWVQKYKSELVIFGGSFYFYETLMRWMGNIVDQ